MTTTTSSDGGPHSTEPQPDPVGPASSHAGRLQAAIDEEDRSARRVMDTPVKGPRGQQMSLAEAQQHAHAVQNKISLDEARESLRHLTVPRLAKTLTLLFLVVIDFPIMLWLSSSVFNVDWSNPLGLPLAISIVISLLGTAGSAWVLHHLGDNRRENKNDRRQLDWSDLSGGARISLIGVGVLIALIAVVMFVRVFTEGVLSGLDGLALLLAVLIAFIMLLAGALVFFTAFRDGSPEQDDLAHYSALVQAGLQRKRAHEDRAARLRNELDMLLGRVRPRTGGPADPSPDRRGPSTDVTPNGAAETLSQDETNGAPDDGPSARIPDTENRPSHRPSPGRPFRVAPRPHGALRRPLQ